MSNPLMSNNLPRLLQRSWQHAFKKASAPGLDGIDIGDFAKDSTNQLLILEKELLNGSYTPHPVRAFQITKGEKTRELGILCIRDRIAQHALSEILSNEYEPLFSVNSYAFRHGYSARMAVVKVCDQIESGDTMVFRSDIEACYDSIQHDLLEEILLERFDTSFVDLLMRSVKLIEHREGVPSTRELGLCQGSPLSPVLLNIFLTDFDKTIEELGAFYLRYCDDFVFLSNNEATLETVENATAEELSKLGLHMKPAKTTIGDVAGGFNFLGFYISDSGSIVETKAVNALAERLEPIINGLASSQREQVLSGQDTFQNTRWHLVSDVLRGWIEYFGFPGHLLEIDPIRLAYAAMSVVDMDSSKMEQILQNLFIDEDIEHWELIAQACYDSGLVSEAVMLYENWFGLVSNSNTSDIDDLLFPLWQQYFYNSNDSSLSLLSQLYIESGNYFLAEILFKNANQDYSSGYDNEGYIPNQLANKKEVLITANEEDADIGEPLLPQTTDIAKRMIQLFCAPNNGYGIEEIDLDEKRSVVIVEDTLNEQTVIRHLSGEVSISAPLYNQSGKVYCIALDVDITNRTLAAESFDMEAKLSKALNISLGIVKEAKRLGLDSILEFSGLRGYHVWIPLSEPIGIADASELTLLLAKTCPDVAQTGIAIERLPGIKRSYTGQKIPVLKLPFGRHPISGAWCSPLDENGKPVVNLAGYLLGFSQNTPSHIKQVLTKFRETQNEAQQASLYSQQELPLSIEELAPLSQGIESLLKRCVVARTLCSMAKKTGYLSHQDRLHLQYVLCGMGAIGRQYLHQVMSWTFNYNYNVTERFVRQDSQFPISCAKLRERYADRGWITECNCVFPAKKGVYPSPVLHAHAEGAVGSATLPLRSNNPEPANITIANEFNVLGQAGELAQKMLSLNQEKRAIDELLKDCRQKLNALLDRQQSDKIEIGFGTLARVRDEHGEIRWVIDIS
ncbi:MAG: reverse transcriptase/maturase family protein [Eubacteriaceae bacterium]|nr:reverse transcriptase/maturase family protein [Eubacteriaceae bacterium]